MNNSIKPVTAILFATILTTVSFAQEQKTKPTQEKTQEIVIRKKGGKTEKMTIVVEGDNVTINGKPVDEFKTDNVTILKREAPVYGASSRTRSFRSPWVRFDGGDSDFLMHNNGNRALLGVMTEKGEDGVKIKDLTKESGAEKAGLQKDDIITKVGDAKVESPEDLIEEINKYKPNDKVDITYKRNGKENKTTATLGENKIKNFNFNFDNKDFSFSMPDAVIPPMENFNFHFNRKPKIGLQIQDVEEGKGVVVKDVDDDSPASKAGLNDGDTITQVNGKDITGVDELRNEIQDINEGETIKITYKRDGKNQAAEIKIPKRLKSAEL